MDGRNSRCADEQLGNQVECSGNYFDSSIMPKMLCEPIVESW